MTLSRKTAIITGGTGTLGRICAERLFDESLNVAIPATSERSLIGISGKLKESPGRFLGEIADLTNEEQVAAFVTHTVEKFGGVDYLVNCAGGYLGGSTIDEVSVDDWEGILRLNLRTAFLMCRAVLKLMKPRRFGRIVNIAASAALAPGVKRGPYAVSKRGVITLTETIAEETKGMGITANAIAPSIIVTDANKESMPDADYSKWVTPEEIANLVVYLLSDEAKSMSGNVIKIYGGG